MPENGDFEELLEFLKRTRGFDFTGYKRPSLKRRIERRMNVVGVEGFDRYLDFLQVDPEEFTYLFNTILINVTAFFRDPQIWSYLETDVVPEIVAGSKDEPIRIWCAACASGEEVYSIAMLFAEALGRKAFVERVKLYATDVDEEALAQARHGLYNEKNLNPVPAEMTRKYFKRQNSQYVFDRVLRRSLIFGRHDLVQDVPISRIDLLLCRNVLMYFNVETQAKVMSNLQFALNDGGFVVLGKAEMLATRSQFFSPVDLRHRVFTKSVMRKAMEPLADPRGPSLDGAALQSLDDLQGRDGAFEAAPLAQLVVDRRGSLALANAHARAQFGLSLEDLGKPFQELDVSYRPAELRTPIDEVKRTNLPLALSDLRHKTATGEVHLDVDLVPLNDAHGAFVGVSVTFRDVTSYAQLREELEQANQELETAMEELQSTNEELETTNEELQSTNEELETTNEELQSTNEELETMNEELQSTNEELGTVNDEMRERTEAVNELNSFLESILSGIRAAVVVVDRSMLVIEWNPEAEELWGLRADEARGQPFFTLDIGLPVDELKPYMKACLDEGAVDSEVSVKGVDRRGRSVDVKVTLGPLRAHAGKNGGVILFMEPATN